MKIIAMTLLTMFFLCSNIYAESLEERIKCMEDRLNQQEKSIQEQRKIIDDLKKELNQSVAKVKETGATVTKQPELQTVRDYRQDDKSTGLYLETAYPIKPYQATKTETPSLLNPAISLILDTFYYNSDLSEEEPEHRTIQGYSSLHGHNGHEEGHKEHSHSHGSIEKGFNLRSAELYLFAPVDPYFNLYAAIPFTEDGVELEEAYFVTTSLPAGLQVKGGKFKSGFGRFNAFHPHAWNFVDAPLPYTAFLGDHGLMEKGVQVTYLPDIPFYTLLGVEVLQGENEILYGADAKSDPHAYTGFAKVSLDFGEHSTILSGGSVTSGKTKTESIGYETEFSGDSTLFGAELTYKWKTSKYKSFLLQSEYLFRNQSGEMENLEASTVESLKRNQDGMYIQALYQTGRWRIGARYDVLDLFTDDFKLAGENIDFGDKPYRLTGSLEFNPTEFSRLRIQYNYDKSARDGKINNEVFLQVILGIGAHGAHPF